MRVRPVVAGVVGVVVGLALAGPSRAVPAGGTGNPPASAASKGLADERSTGTGYRYVAGSQYATATGATVQLQQAQPRGVSGRGHSLAELSVESRDHKQIVEIGWTVDPETNGDTAPHLFVFHWVNGKHTCYNGCGFVSTSTTKPGAPVPVNASGTYQIRHRTGQWQLSYNGTGIGYYPDSLWNGRYTRAGLVQTFGEVYAAASSCADMGNGTFGHASGSARIAGFKLIGSSAHAKLTMRVTDRSRYDSGAVTATSFRFGGPGAC